ncbi:helix-turn-helix transcriptional regulator [Salinibacter grassmerensis]|uniref:helix-turn-helix transcriptional regulator n=1 Tax=Salinibacter grassmerensis TaxID=3040353 RepID=UPI0021E74DD1|nr:transcriptional regulator [Salinibacter grassmerensis]
MSFLGLLQSETKRRLLQLMKRQGEITLNDATQDIDRARPTLRDHLDQMGRDGLVARRSKRQGRGRPSICYRITPLAERLFPGREGTVFAEFLSYLQSQGQDRLIEEFFQSFWNDRLGEVENRLADPLESASIREIVDVLEEVLEENGFMPEVRVEEKEVTVKACNCPFAEIISTTELPCASETCFYEALFERVERTRHIPDGDTACAYELPVVQT